MLSKFQFIDMDIGNRAPHLSNIQVYIKKTITEAQNEIIMDLNFK